MKKNSWLILCSLFAVFLAFSLGYYFGNTARDFVVIKGEEAKGLLPVAVAPVEKDVPPVDVNTASKEELMTIPGIGETYAEDILRLRDQYGSLKSVWDLDPLKGFSEEKLAQLAPYMIFS